MEVRMFLFSFVLSCTLIENTYSEIPKHYLESLLSNYFFKGYDLILSVKKDSEENVLSWMRESNNSAFSILLDRGDLFQTLELVRLNSRNLEQMAIIVEFQNITYLQEQMKMAKSYSKNTTVPQPFFFVIAPNPETYNMLRKNVSELKQVSLEITINSDFYFFGEQANNNEPDELYFEQLRNKNQLEPGTDYGGYPLPPGFGLTELYSLKNKTFLHQLNLTTHNLLQKVVRRANFRKAPIIAVAQPDFEQGAKFSENFTELESGYEADQINFIASSFNFTLIPKVGTGWISKDNDSLTGMGAQLVKNEADIGISSSEMLPYRAKFLTFMQPTYYTTIYGFFREPTSTLLRDIFLTAFTLELWMTMFATWFLIVAAMIALAIVKWKQGTLHENDKIIVQEVVIWAIGAICQQGWHVCPESGSMKIVFIFALITGLVSYVGYSAALVSILSVKVVPIQSLEDLVQNRYTIYTDNQTDGTNDIGKYLESRMKMLPIQERSIPTTEAIPKLMKSKAAFLGVLDIFYPVAKEAMGTDRNVCKNVHRVSISKNRPIQGGMFLRKRSPLAEFFNQRVLLMYERGIRFRLMQQYIKENSLSCLDLNASEKDPLGFNDVVTAYVILFIGYVLSLTFLVFEKLCVTTLPSSHMEHYHGSLITYSTSE